MAVYYPYLRAKQFDVIAVERAAAALVKNGKIVPILEPVKVNGAGLIKRAASFAAHGLPVSLVINPKVGELVGNSVETTTLLSTMRAAGAMVSPTLIVDETTKKVDVDRLQQVAAGGRSVLVHRAVPSDSQAQTAAQSVPDAEHLFHEGMTSAVYEASFPVRGRQRDGFKVQIRNASYPPQSFFSDLHITFGQLGFTAFGDFATVGQTYSEGGGPAYAVAIHMTETQPTGIVCHHFVSTSNDTQANPAGKFGEAVAKLVSYCTTNPGRLDFSIACQEIIGLHAQGHFPGLGDLKRLSIQHHLELMSTIV